MGELEEVTAALERCDPDDLARWLDFIGRRDSRVRAVRNLLGTADDWDESMIARLEAAFDSGERALTRLRVSRARTLAEIAQLNQDAAAARGYGAQSAIIGD